MTTIGDYAFKDCTGLTNINIPNSVTSVGSSAFFNTGIYSNSPDGVFYVDKWVCGYKGEKPSNVLTLAEGTRGISSSSFSNCFDLTSVVIPNSVTSIGNNAFNGCTSLMSVTCPNSLTSIGNNAFENCYSLTSIIIPNSVTSIGSYAFRDCFGLTRVTIGNSVMTIGSYAFYGCFSLTSVRVKRETPISIDSSTFTYKNAILYVPHGCKETYEASYWKYFKQIVEIPEILMSTDISQMENVIYMENAEERCGTQATLSLRMKNLAPIRSFQFDLYLPDGVTVAKTEKGKIMGQLSPGRLPDGDEHELTFSEQPDGAIRFLCSSQYPENFTGSDGEVATLTVNVAEMIEDGDYPVLLKNLVLNETDITRFYETDLVQSVLTIVSFVLGDINSDGIVNVLDYTGVANHIHGATPTGFVVRAADVDENGVIDVRDYTGVANIIHTGSATGTPANQAAAQQSRQEREPQ